MLAAIAAAGRGQTAEPDDTMATTPNNSAANLIFVLIFMANPWLDWFFLPDP
jgi:hypothetical protein